MNDVIFLQILLLPDRPMQYCPTELLHRPLPPPPPHHPHHLLILLLLLLHLNLHIIQHNQPLLCPFIGDEDSFGASSTFDASPFSGSTENLDPLSFGAPAPFFGAAACVLQSSLVVGERSRGVASSSDIVLTPTPAMNHIN